MLHAEKFLFTDCWQLSDSKEYIANRFTLLPPIFELRKSFYTIAHAFLYKGASRLLKS